MKVRNDKGITLISLIITVIILVIITYAAVNLSIGVSETARFQNIETYMLLIQTKCEYLANEKAIGEIDEKGLYGELQTTGDYSGWYKLKQADLNAIGVKEAKEKDGYYVNYDNNDVAYEKGIEADGYIFYKLSSIRNYMDEQNWR